MGNEQTITDEQHENMTVYPKSEVILEFSGEKKFEIRSIKDTESTGFSSEQNLQGSALIDENEEMIDSSSLLKIKNDNSSLENSVRIPSYSPVFYIVGTFLSNKELMDLQLMNRHFRKNVIPVAMQGMVT